MVIEYLLPLLKTHGMLLSFIGGFITGETIIILLAFLSAIGLIPLWYVLVFCTIGMYLSDFVPFTLGRFKFWKKFYTGKMEKHAKNIEIKFLRYTKNNLFLTLFYTKFIYGLSIPALIYLGHKKTTYRRFALYNLFVEMVFVPIVVLIGWYSGKGFTLARTIFKDIRVAIFLLIILVIILTLIRKWMDQKLIKKQRLLK